MILLEPEFIKKIEYLKIISRKFFCGNIKGEHRSRKKGVSPEFADYRNYSTGDDLRYIDWNLYSRLEKLFLKLFLEEEELSVYIILDTSASMDYGEPSKINYGLKIAASLGYISLSNMNKFSFITFSENSNFKINPVRGKGHFINLLKYLEGIKPSGKTNLNESIKNFSLKASKSGIVILISDFLDDKGYEEGINFMIYKKFNPFLIQILSPQELNPELNGNIKLIDIETLQEKDLTINKAMLDIYINHLNSFIIKLHSFSAKKGIQHIMTSTSLPFEDLVLETLKRGELLK